MQLGAGPRLIVGVDYGTTSTGVTCALTNDLQIGPVWTVFKWPGGEECGFRHLKVPSRISYQQNRQMPSDWGFRCQPNSETYSWTKLLLGIQSSSDQASETNTFNDPILEEVMRMGILKLPDGKSAVKVIADFLRCVTEYVLTHLPEPMAQVCQSGAGIDYWITVPATWSAERRTLMRHAAQMAGFGSRAEDRVFFLSEPEAAMHAVPYMDGVDLQPGDGVLVCDCGGGTVDVASFLIRESGSRPNFERLSADIGMYDTDDA
ncbi:hypothetical protein BDW42DRAFT_186149 [Aspergillus taichungensis]|uniref:Actin-like ATPase domain-containing protein n=1 Tax=Aspergillus taichungensis TaxID=482145 RepID=A0A2J5HSG6_9EURO|nr:hypothetical protein BDW42DRAFT_186149 [Aspergillus taichungensis]